MQSAAGHQARLDAPEQTRLIDSGRDGLQLFLRRLRSTASSRPGVVLYLHGATFRRRFLLLTGSAVSRGAMRSVVRAWTSGRSTSWGSVDRTGIRRWKLTPRSTPHSAWRSTCSSRSRRRYSSFSTRATPRIDRALRRARTCYDHIAGELGVAIADGLVRLGVVDLTIDGAAVTETGRVALLAAGIQLDRPGRNKRVYCRPCLDWSEGRPHIAGMLGAALLERALAVGLVRRRKGSRVLDISGSHETNVLRRLGFDESADRLLTSEPDVFCADAYLRFGVEPDLMRVASKSKANATLSSWCTAVPLLLVSDDT
jgi:hypothetical protein